MKNIFRRNRFAQLGDDENENELAGLVGDDDNTITSNVHGSIVDLQQLLQFTPFRGKISKNRQDHFGDPIVSGMVRRRKQNLSNSGYETVYMEIVDSIVYVRNNENSRRNKIAARISFICADSISVDDEVAENSEVHELYNSVMERHGTFNSFRIYTPTKILTFYAPSPEKQDEIVSSCKEHLETIFDANLWKDKEEAAEKLEPLLREQLIYDLERQEEVVNALAITGLMPSSSILSSPKKTKSGVLKLFQTAGDEHERDDEDEKSDEENEDHAEEAWREFFFVLLKGVLYYFKSSKSHIPTGFVSLSYASVEIDQRSLMQDEMIFTVHTPIRTLTLKCKHKVSLASWISALDKGVKKASQKRQSFFVQDPQEHEQGKTEQDILEDIERMHSPVASLSTLLKNPNGITSFESYLDNVGGGHELQCLRQIKGLSVVREDEKAELEDKIRDLVTTFVDRDSEMRIDSLDNDVVDNLMNMDYNDVSIETVKDIWEGVVESLKQRFEGYKDSEQYQEFVGSLKDPNSIEQRLVPDFQIADNECLAFKVRSKRGKKTKTIRLDMSKNSATIGRDVSSDIVIDDERVSRSHARIEYDQYHLRFLDMGSCYGAKLNGERFTTALVDIGDTIRIGGTYLDLIVKDKKKKLFSL